MSKIEDSKMSIINGKGSINKDAYTYVYAIKRMCKSKFSLVLFKI